MLIVPPGWLRLLRTSAANSTSAAGRTSPANPSSLANPASSAGRTSSAGGAATGALLLHWQRLTPRAAAAAAAAAAMTCPPLPLLAMPAAVCGGGDQGAWAVRRLRPPTQLAAFLALSATVARLSREGGQATAEAKAGAEAEAEVEAGVEAGARVEVEAEAEAEVGALAGGGEEGGVSGPLLLLRAVTASLALEWTPPGTLPSYHP